MKKLLVLTVCAFLAFTSFAGNVTVPVNTNYLVGTSAPYTSLTPGDTLFFTAGHYDYIYLKNFTMGTLSKPIIVIPKGGEVIINTTFSYGMKVGGCTYMHLIGGYPNYQMTGFNFTADTAHCGFQVRGVTSGAGVSIGDLSSYVEIDHFYIANTAIIGLFYKTDPDCTGYGQRQNFVQRNTWIHDNVIAHTGGEGMYVGSSWYTGEPYLCAGDTVSPNGDTIYPAILANAQIYRNSVWYSGWDGIQASCMRYGSSIHNNWVFYAATQDVYAQNSGYIIGGGDSCDVYDNYAWKCKEDSYDVFLSGGNFYNNEAWYSGTGGSAQYEDAIFEKDVATTPGASINFINNLVVGYKTAGLVMQTSLSANDLVENNIFINPTGVYTQFYYNNVIQRNNYENTSIASAQFADTLGNLQSTSPLIDAGYAIPYITTDFFGNQRVVGNAIDIGPVEYQGSSGDTVPSVTTASITNITQTTATGGGNVTSGGGASVTARGVCWSTTVNPTTSNSKTTDGTGTGAFTSNLTGLTANTLYYVRAYATNSVGTSYGNQVSFTTLTSALPTVTTTPVSNITQGTATSGGNVTSDGGNPVTARGVCWSTTTNPTISNSKTSDGTGTGTYTSSITGLTANTLYYVRAYATNSVGTAYGNQVSFTTLPYALPTVTTATITNITQTTATGGGTVTSDGGTTVTARGVCWSTTTNPTISNSKTSDGTGTGTYTSSITGLTANTLYYVRAYATNSVGTAYGNQVSFTTLPYALPTVTTATITNITQTTATGGGTVTSDGGTTVTARGVCWSTTTNPTTSNSFTTNGSGIGTFTSSLTGLTAGTLYYVRAYATNISGTAYGNQITFTTLSPSLPTVTTTAITNITQTTATGGGNVTSDGGTPVTARGVCWSTTANPTTSNSFTTDGTGTGSYVSNLTGLTANTLYYVRAYATNSAGTSYGNQVTFTTLAYPLPTVTTSAISNITQTTATGGGNVTSDGGTPVTARGVCWSTSANPTLSNNYTSDGTGTGTFTSNLTGLTANTLYYVRAYATNSAGTSYGNQVTFTTLAYPLPTVTTSIITNITQTTATGGGNVTSDGGTPVTARGVCWSTSANPTLSNNYTSDGTGTGTFTSNLTGLTANTLYYVRAYATNISGTSYGSQVTFTTLSYPLPTVTTSIITNITQTTATGGGNVTSDGGTPVTARGVCWSTSTNPTIADDTTSDGTGTGNFTSNLTGLTANTIYYVRAYATNSVGTSYGNQVSFTTLMPLPTLTTTPVSNITQGTATSGGNVTSDGGNPVTARGVCWSTTTNPTISNSKTSDGTGTGTYTSSITGLTANTLYYVRAYATNSVGTAYGNQVSFTTLPYALPTVTTATITNITQTTATGGGTVTSDGGTTVTARGVCWSTTTNPTTSNSFTTNGSGIGTFTSSLTGLTAGTLYYVRAYATNISGTAYGNQITFTTLSPSLPTVTTTAITNITQTTATGGGNVTSDGGTPVTARGVCWSTTANPTTSNSFTTDGTGTGSYVSNLTGLTANTLYYVRAYATNSAGTSYGNQVTFTTLAYPLPTVTTSAISNITQTTATGGGNVTSDGGTPVTARGVCWSTSANPTLSNNYTSDGTGTGTFTSNLTGLTANTLYYVRAYATNSAGTSYGNQVTFTTLAYPLPTVTTSIITNITQTTATGGGNVTSDGGTPVTARGVCWSTSANPTLSNNYTSDGTGTGTFTSNLTGLTANTLYYVRAYATNISGTSYGSQVTFTTLSYPLPTVTTSIITNITQTTATGGGNVTSDGGTPVTARGVCWSTSTNPTLSNSYTTDGTGTGSYTSNLTGLAANTFYYVRAYATNITGTSYGTQVTFTSLSYPPPTVTTTSVTNITQTTATSGGNVTSDGGVPVTARGVCWSTSANPTTANSYTTDGTGTGTFTSNLTGLNPNTLYYVRAYATNSTGTSYGNQVTFTSLSYPPPTVTTTSVTNITQTTATSGGNVTSNSGTPVTARGVCWSTSTNPTIADDITSDGTGTGNFTSNLTGLTANTIYYVRAYATNISGTSYGNQVTFHTLNCSLPSVTTSAVTNITPTTATGGGDVISDGGAPVITKGVCWSTSQYPTIYNSITTDGSDTGNFTSSITGLMADTVYYVRAYATNSMGTSYGKQVSFTTLSFLPTVMTFPVGEITRSSAISGGDVTSSGGSKVTARGVCWNTSANPTTTNYKTNDGSGVGIYMSSINGLYPGTMYYLRAYATNSAGTSYGDQVTFITQDLMEPDSTEGTESINYGSTMILYPNPVQTTLNISYFLTDVSDVEISVFNFTGVRYFYLLKHLESGSQLVTFDVSQLPDGLYVVKSHSANYDATSKFIKVE